MRLVDADKLKEDMIRGCRRIGKEMGVVLPTSAFVNIIDKAPTIEYTFEEAFQKTVCEQELYCPKRPHGRWIEEPVPIGLIGRGNGQYRCSNCQHGDIHAKTQEVPYCWYCGAKMDGGAEE